MPTACLCLRLQEQVVKAAHTRHKNAPVSFVKKQSIHKEQGLAPCWIRSTRLCGIGTLIYVSHCTEYELKKSLGRLLLHADVIEVEVGREERAMLVLLVRGLSTSSLWEQRRNSYRIWIMLKIKEEKAHLLFPTTTIDDILPEQRNYSYNEYCYYNAHLYTFWRNHRSLSWWERHQWRNKNRFHQPLQSMISQFDIMWFYYYHWYQTNVYRTTRLCDESSQHDWHPYLRFWLHRMCEWKEPLGHLLSWDKILLYSYLSLRSCCVFVVPSYLFILTILQEMPLKIQQNRRNNTSEEFLYFLTF